MGAFILGIGVVTVVAMDQIIASASTRILVALCGQHLTSKEAIEREILAVVLVSRAEERILGSWCGDLETNISLIGYLR